MINFRDMSCPLLLIKQASSGHGSEACRLFLGGFHRWTSDSSSGSFSTIFGDCNSIYFLLLCVFSQVSLEISSWTRSAGSCIDITRKRKKNGLFVVSMIFSRYDVKKTIANVEQEAGGETETRCFLFIIMGNYRNRYCKQVSAEIFSLTCEWLNRVYQVEAIFHLVVTWKI